MTKEPLLIFQPIFYVNNIKEAGFQYLLKKTWNFFLCMVSGWHLPKQEGMKNE
ncbi:Uncharacterized protein dnm_017500 [Desulfonema magnum]|uniref:Uncharacterized protein n=1 Tax=Desulfonema magnum TaxID=45655 RepID=A0A975GLE0_9BACT|nr:Uncharacterized protein dnm_017500 [Desulfonema magnum]